MEELNKKIKELEDRVRQLEGRRILQMDIMPQVVKSRHIDSTETGLYFETSSGFKRIGIGSLSSYLWEPSAGILRTPSELIVDNVLTAGSSIKLYNTGFYILFGDGANGYDTNLYRVSTNTLGTDDDMKFTATAKGPLLIDRTTATVYRLKVTSGVLGIEAV